MTLVVIILFVILPSIQREIKSIQEEKRTREDFVLTLLNNSNSIVRLTECLLDKVENICNEIETSNNSGITDDSAIAAISGINGHLIQLEAHLIGSEMTELHSQIQRISNEFSTFVNENRKNLISSLDYSYIDSLKTSFSTFVSDKGDIESRAKILASELSNIKIPPVLN